MLKAKLATLNLPASVKVDFGGDAEGSGEANSAIMRNLPIGLLLLLGVLLAEFNSFRRVLIILTTVPLAAAGVVPGLLIGNQPFGFMSLLGVIALVGIVVNNAIVLLEVVENRRTDGADVPTALEEAVARRIRPILLTTATTVAGLLPLAVSSSTLWPPPGIGHDFRADLVHALDPGGGAGVVPGTPAFCESKGRQTAFIRVVDRTFIFQLSTFF